MCFGGFCTPEYIHHQEEQHENFEMNLKSRFQIVGKDTSVPLPITWWVMRKYFTIIQHVEHIRSR